MSSETKRDLEQFAAEFCKDCDLPPPRGRQFRMFYIGYMAGVQEARLATARVAVFGDSSFEQQMRPRAAWRAQ